MNYRLLRAIQSISESISISKPRRPIGHTRPVAIVSILCLAVAFCWSQGAGKKKKRGPRALAVVQWEGDPQKPSNPVLTPIAVLDDDRFRDANAYYASPVPLAVDFGVVYDVQKTGRVIGSFTIGTPKRDAQGRWYGVGNFELPYSETAKAKSEVQLKTKAPASSDTSSGEKSDKGGSASPADNDPDRPRIRRGPPPPQQTTERQDPEIAKIDTDPNRPKLKRPVPQEEKPQAKQQDPLAILKAPNLNVAVAVSDESGADPRPYVYALKPDEEEKYRDILLKMAAAELAKKGPAPSVVRAPDSTASSGSEPPPPSDDGQPPVLKRGAPAPATPSKPASTPARKTAPAPAAKKPALKKTAGTNAGPQFTDIRLYAFDLNTNNAPLLWLTAKTTEASERYVAVAAWLEVDLTVRRIFVQATDKNHLDVYPRLEMVDALDIKGNGRGDLVLRAYGDRGSRFVLYHAAPDSLEPLFDPENQ